MPGSLAPAAAKALLAARRPLAILDAREEGEFAEGHLLWAWDIAALGRELGSHASARLARAQ